MVFYRQNKEEVIDELKSSPKGLTSESANSRLAKYGHNILNIRGESLFKKIIEPFRSIFVLILAIAAGLSLLKHEPIDAVIIITIIVISAVIYYVQRASTDRVLRALKKHDALIVSVWRDGALTRVDSEFLVPGDVIDISEGEKIPADARVLHSENGRIDEALLTGESEPVGKNANALHKEHAIYEQSNMLFQGSFVVSGSIEAIVTTTGNQTEFGRLAQLAGDNNMESPVQNKIDKLVTAIVFVTMAIMVLFFALSYFRGNDMSETVTFMLAMAVSAVPEGLPVAISVVLVLGMHRMAKKKMLVRSMSAIENIGLLTMIATDKTGTLTKNKLKVQDVWEVSPKSDLRQTANIIDKTIVHNEGGKSYDPLDDAFISFSSEYSDNKNTHKDKLMQVLPFDQSFAMSGTVWQGYGEKNYHVYIKGAPEKIIKSCRLSKNDKKNIEQELHSMTSKGLRVIAVATGSYTSNVTSFKEVTKHKLHFVSLVAVSDELREEAIGAIAEARQAGVNVVMITGDHAETAYTIGKQIGLVDCRSEVFDSRALDDHSKPHVNMAHHMYSSKVFARVTPENKYKILTTLKKKHIVAMTGDGVNDVPALSKSHIGIAMGSGTQIAKESADMVILDDNFSTIVTALKEGRIIFANIRRMLFFLLSTSAGEVLTMVGALVIGVPLPVVAVQLLWINLVTDTSLVIPLGLEPAEDDVMKHTPRKPNQPILDRYLISRMVLIALTMAAVTLGVFTYFLQDYSEDYARTIAFTVLVAMQWGNGFNARSDKKSALGRLKTFNGKFAIGLSAAIGLQLLALFGPLQSVLKLVPVDFGQIAIATAASVTIIITVSEMHKLWGRRSSES